MIEINNLTKSFHTNVVLNDLSLDIKKGDVVAIIGPSGSGKSTFLRCINYLEEPDSGTVKIDELKVDYQKKTKQEIRNLRQSTAMVFQQFNLFRQKTALENVMEGLLIVKKLPRQQAEQLALAQLERVGLLDRIHYYPRQLSGGQQQRVAIARALAMNPKLLLFDEPTSALDPELVGEVLDTIRSAAADGNTMIIVSHELRFVYHVATRVLFLDGGKIIEDGSPKEVFVNPKNERTKNFIAKFFGDQDPEYFI